jgi:hypothetical protein
VRSGSGAASGFAARSRKSIVNSAYSGRADFAVRTRGDR